MHTTYGSIGVVSKGFPSGLADIFLSSEFNFFCLTGMLFRGRFFFFSPASFHHERAMKRQRFRTAEFPADGWRECLFTWKADEGAPVRLRRRKIIP